MKLIVQNRNGRKVGIVSSNLTHFKDKVKTIFGFVSQASKKFKTQQFQIII